MGGGGGFVSAITDPISDVLGTSGGGGGLLGAVEDVGGFIGDAGAVIDQNVLQPALQDPVGTIVKVGAIAAAPATGGASLYAIPAYTATKAIAAGVPIEDVAKMTAISAAATAAGVSVADYVGTLAEFGTEIGSQQTAMLAAQNAGIGTGGAASTAIGQVAGGAAGGAIGTGLAGGDVGQGLLSGATNAALAQGVNLGVDAAGNLLSNIGSNVPTGTTTGTTGMDETLFGPTYAELGYDPFANIGDVEAQLGGFYGGGTAPTATILPGELGDIILDANGNVVLSSGADIQAAQSLGFDTTTLTNYAKQFGTAALRSLLGTRGGSAAGGAAGGTGTQGGLFNAGANYFLSDAARRAIQAASQQSTAQQLAATQQAQQAATFRPVGVTTAFGQSQFQFDPTTGQLVSAGYTATPEVAAQRQRLFGLGAEALPTTADTRAIQEQYIAEQQGLLAPGREQQLAQLRNRQYQTGRTGLATGGTVAGYAPGQAGLMQTNPELAAYYNSIAQQNAALAANAPTYAQDLLNKRIATGTGLFTQAGQLESMAQQPLTLGTGLGTAAATAGRNVGLLGLSGTQGASQTQLYGNIASASGQLGQMQGLLNGVSPYLQQAGESIIKNWLV
jgi:hypothetical protein